MVFDAYWAALDWKALGAFAGVVGAIATPFLKDWWQHRAEGREGRVQAAENLAQRLERIANEQYERAITERDHYAQRAREAANEAEQNKREARAMEDWAHWFRHGWANGVQKYINLAELFDRLARGDLAPESARVISTQVGANMPDRPRQVPSLREATETAPVAQTPP